MIGAAAMVSASGCSNGVKSRWMDQTMPDFSLNTLDGERVSLSEQRGNLVLLTFWAVG